MRQLFILGLVLCCGLAQAQTYRWVDRTGRTVISDTPPPGQIRQVEKTIDEGKPDDGLSYATRKAATAFPVTLYTASDCQSTCQQARELLNARRIPFTEKPIKTAVDALEMKQLFGDAFVPSLKVGNQRSRGFEADTWDNLLDLAGYPKSAGKTP
ncbi:MAG: glutaredoxin family protein [Dechloromonas sp.]|nr:glutaredoxin family protein [Dechloromonas sp.]